ncbi:MAG TPA: HAMP domain-containing sensor histidine kinase [Acidobacteriota bacterium]|nr:HAMP domain-containing sensor histidine kinase [Acidobacteriota bacterium]
MLSKKNYCLGLLLLSIALGALLLVTQALADGRFSYSLAPLSAASQSRQSAKPPSVEEVGATSIESALESLRNNKDAVVYVSVGFIGVFIIVLIIGSAALNSKTRTEAQLEILIQEKEKAENLARLKSEFLNQVSHELRTPLAVIIGYIECMTDGLYGQIESKHQEILQVVAKQSAHLKNMIDQILIYSRLEAGKQPVRLEELHVTKIVNDMKDTFEFLCRQKGLDLNWDLPKDSMPVRSDAVRLKEVISNLLQNAVKYTDHGSVIFRMVKLPDKDFLKIEVADTGMGISEQHLTSIFEPFMQAHKTSTTNSRGGIGLGLSIVKKHLEQIGGRISVESELGKGSTFRIILPRNFDDQKVKATWLSKLLSFRPFSNKIEEPLSKPLASGAGQKTVDTRHAMG